MEMCHGSRQAITEWAEAGMESIYYVMCWACHRKCRHCYEERFRPYVRDELDAVVAEAKRNFPRILANFPADMTYLDREGCEPGGLPVRRGGRIVLSGGESLLDPVRTEITYPVIDALNAKYRGQGVRIVVQTTGDLLTRPIVEDLLARGVYMIAVASTDRFHVGIDTPERQAAFIDELSALFDACGLKPSMLSSGVGRKWDEETGPLYSFFGASEGSWIGKIWPRGRGWHNDLSTATLADNFCARWSGGMGFLDHRVDGSEVSVEPDGAVYPCCIKTALPLGSLLEDNLIDILDSLATEPAFQAINAGRPERMGLSYGWFEETFLERSRTVTPAGRPYENLCIGCDAFHREVLGPVIEAARQRRRHRPLVPAA
ncbi:hypothetical protein BLTE_01260 [Blastochloris tepida]|uniref:4Fe4S-binding SPASM domain-containing protein n=2 Tax=Blastochloris tepida TaxID=2233851 RepID=A0A348FVV8_9HYPH|nr:hypothetical protein BLTE_01260 [Blastochloris tepida]